MDRNDQPFAAVREAAEKIDLFYHGKPLSDNNGVVFPAELENQKVRVALVEDIIQKAIDANQPMTVTERWERGVDHHPESVRIMKLLMEADMKHGEDSFCWKVGGDGDNGESLMFMLDALFDTTSSPSLDEINDFWFDQHQTIARERDDLKTQLTEANAKVERLTRERDEANDQLDAVIHCLPGEHDTNEPEVANLVKLVVTNMLAEVERLREALANIARQPVCYSCSSTEQAKAALKPSEEGK